MADEKEDEELNADERQAKADAIASSRRFRQAVAISVIWVALSGVVGWFANGDEEGLTYGSLRPNEWGDFAAGVFAPIAFLWLVFAVWVQSKELAAQRKELEYTRKELIATRAEMKEQRTVMQAQADEAKNQADFIGAQTDILRDEEARRKCEVADESYDELVALLKRDLNNTRISIWRGGGPFFRYTDSFDDPNIPFESFGIRVRTNYDDFAAQITEEKLNDIHIEDRDSFLVIRETLCDIMKLAPSLSFRKKRQLDRCQYDMAISVMNDMVELEDLAAANDKNSEN